jgi:large subunit ribosomal protein L6e
MVKQFEWYPADDVSRAVRTKKAKAPKLRSSIKAGQVLILLSGRFRGKRVVFLKQLSSGLLLVTGPHKVNGVPLKRVNQVYTMSTSTTVDLKGVDVAKVDDATFKRAQQRKGYKSCRKFFSEEAAKSTVSAERVALQKSVDAALKKNCKKDMLAYLKARFTLTDGDKPHAMKF